MISSISQSIEWRDSTLGWTVLNYIYRSFGLRLNGGECYGDTWKNNEWVSGQRIRSFIHSSIHFQMPPCRRSILCDIFQCGLSIRLCNNSSGVYFALKLLSSHSNNVFGLSALSSRVTIMNFGRNEICTYHACDWFSVHYFVNKFYVI